MRGFLWVKSSDIGFLGLHYYLSLVTDMTVNPKKLFLMVCLVLTISSPTNRFFNDTGISSKQWFFNSIQYFINHYYLAYYTSSNWYGSRSDFAIRTASSSISRFDIATSLTWFKKQWKAIRLIKSMGMTSALHIF
ncbi:hypothetical protein THRCLA_22779 [Thraustotheca clavata]|uniref:Uncharacterized protein n=1 Tax=Thraustotheca clavata TaxID=74557 RepID=A0A1V9YT33_9STRA|nr:hypothetical protein THRCLA_22779 [Thraustotheca clavata]